MTKFYCQPDMTSWSVLRTFYDGIWKSDHDFLIAFHSNFVYGMHGFRDGEVLLQAEYDVIMISPPGALRTIFHVEFWKSDYNFMIVIYSNFLYAMHGFRDNEVLLPTSYDVIARPPPARTFSCQKVLKLRPRLPERSIVIVHLGRMVSEIRGL